MTLKFVSVKCPTKLYDTVIKYYNDNNVMCYTKSAGNVETRIHFLYDDILSNIDDLSEMKLYLKMIDPRIKIKLPEQVT